MNLLVIDTETTGLLEDPDARVIEIAAAVYSTFHRTTLWAGGGLVPSGGPVPESSTEIHGITRGMLDEACSFEIASEYACRAYVAHNAAFDREMMVRGGHLGKRDLPWVCSVDDLVFPRGGHSRALSHLAVDHDLKIGNLHRALDDVLLLCQLLRLVPDLEEQVERALEPQGIFRACVSYNHRGVAKNAGFRWNREGFEQCWTKKMPIASTDLESTEERPFQVVLLCSVPACATQVSQ